MQHTDDEDFWDTQKGQYLCEKPKGDLHELHSFDPNSQSAHLDYSRIHKTVWKNWVMKITKRGCSFTLYKDYLPLCSLVFGNESYNCTNWACNYKMQEFWPLGREYSSHWF